MYGTVSYMRTTRTPDTQPGTSRFAALARLRCPGALEAGRGGGREVAICAAVVELLNEGSYESVSMDAVAARAKASKATIYRRWQNKDDLVIDAVRRLLSTGGEVVSDRGNLRDDLVDGTVHQLSDPLVFAATMAATKALVHAAPNDPQLAGALRAVLQSAQLGPLQTVLDRAHQRGELTRPVDGQLVFEVVQAQFCARSGLGAEQVDVDYIRHVVDDVLMPVIRHAGAASSAPSP